MTVGELARTIPIINEALENQQVEYQTSMVEVEGIENLPRDPIMMKETARICLSLRKDQPKETMYLHLCALRNIQEETPGHYKIVLCATIVVIVVNQ